LADSSTIREPTPAEMASVDAWYWCHLNQIKLAHGVYTTKGHEYQVEPMQDRSRVCVSMKGAQLGWSEQEVLKTLWGMIYGVYKKGVLYLFPTSDDVSDFSMSRFSPLIADNPCIGKYVQSTDRANIKRIGRAMLYLRGARSTTKVEGLKKDASKLRSIPVDKLVCDELDLMDPDMVVMAQERLSHSDVKEESYLSTPTIPDFGIDKMYKNSDMRVWMIKCPSCGRDCCLELDFPDCVKQKDGKWYRACVKCGQMLRPVEGEWVAQSPGKPIVGRWISQLNSLYVDPGDILKLYQDPPNGNLQEIYNSKLGMAYIAAENRLTVNDVYSCCSHDRISSGQRKYATGMGVDVGKDLHVVIGRRLENGRKKILYVGCVPDFNDLHSLAAKFNVRQCVIDLYPETRKVREFQASESFKVFGCQYMDEMKEGERKDEVSNVITFARTELCDITHNSIMQGLYELPARCPTVEVYAKQMAAVVKVLEEDERRGTRVYRYRKLESDHYRHATNYFELASRDLSMESLDPLDQMRNVIQMNDDKYDDLRAGIGGH
jgi:hypothetical protein